MSGKYRAQVTVEAVQFTGTGPSCDEVTEFLGGTSAPGHMWKSCTNDGGFIGDREFSPGDWIIKGVTGEFFPMPPEVFAATYEPMGARQCPACGAVMLVGDDGVMPVHDTPGGSQCGGSGWRFQG